MKAYVIILLVCICSSCATSKMSLPIKSLDGSWVPIKQEMAGKEFPSSVYQLQVLTIAGNTYTLVAESLDKGELNYSNGKMDIYGKQGVNAGKHFPAIYKNENELLTICYDLSGKDYPATFDTKGHPLYFLSVYKKK